MSSSTEWLSPDEWAKRTVPRLPGVYLLRVIDETGSPIKWPRTEKYDASNEATKGIKFHELDGVLYIGLAGRLVGVDERPSRNTLSARFKGDLVGSWKTGSKANSKGKWKHDSRKHYEDKPDLKAIYPLDRIQVCCIPMVPSAWLKRVPSDVQDIVDAFDWDQANSYVVNLEAFLIQKFKRCFGTIPVLNDKEEGKGDKPVSEEDLEERLKELESTMETHDLLLQESEEGIMGSFPSEIATFLESRLTARGVNIVIEDDSSFEMSETTETIHQPQANGVVVIDSEGLDLVESEVWVIFPDETDLAKVRLLISDAMDEFDQLKGEEESDRDKDALETPLEG